MPDPTRKTLSATESPALFNASPYVTRWMLWQRFAKGMAIDSPEDERMVWGRLMQSLIIAYTANELRLEAIPNTNDNYVRRGLLGCTRDATIICPDRGPGALETKCVFDYGVWMRDWNEGRQPPRQHEIQLQQQMLVGDEGGESYEWGIIAAWVCGEVHYFERKPLADFWAPLYQEAERFFDDVRAGNEPDPFGAPVEVPLLKKLFPLIAGKTVDLSTRDDAAEIIKAAVEYKAAKEQESAGAAVAEPLRARLLALAKDADTLELGDGIRVTIRKSGAHGGRRVRVYVPDTSVHATHIPDDILMAG